LASQPCSEGLQLPTAGKVMDPVMLRPHEFDPTCRWYRRFLGGLRTEDSASR
jgi:hypothetical protein